MILEANNICINYGEAIALQNVTVRIGKGEIVSIIGANGAGKTTFLNGLSGTKDIKSGSMEFDGKEVINVPSYRRLSLGLAHVPENRRLFPDMTVRENLYMGSYGTHLWKDRHEIMAEILEDFPRVQERLNQRAGTLSGGERQMVAICRGLMSRPKLIMIDEPSLGLAPTILDTIQDVIVRINKSGVAILIVEQNVQFVLRLAARVYVMETGHIVRESDAESLFDDDEIRKSYLGL